MFLAYMFINLVNCRFLSHPITVCKTKFNTHLFLFLCSRFHKAEITSRRILYYVGMHFYCVGTYPMLRREAISTASGEILRKMKSINMQTFAQIFCLIYIIFAHTYWNKA